MLRKPIKLLFQIFGILLIVETVYSYGLGNVGNNNNNNNENHSTTFGSSASAATSTPASLLSTYLASFTFSESQSPLTTIIQQSLGSTTTSGKLHDTTQIPADYLRTSIQPAQTNSPAIISAPADITQTSTTLDSHPETTATVASKNDHILLGCGPNNREGIGIQRALDWLREKRSADYGWDSDTHMVILAKEVSDELIFHFPILMNSHFS
jgi:hypothetical protein